MKQLKTGLVATVVAILMVVMGGLGAAAAQEATPASTPVVGTGIEGATAWLLAQQAEDGGFVGFSGESDPGATLDAITALVAAQHAGIDTGDAIDRAVAWLGSGDVALVYVQTGVGQAAKLILGLTSAGIDPTGFAGVDPLPLITNGQNPDTGLYGLGVYDHALSMLALAATGSQIPASAIDALAATQSESGGWAFDASTDAAMSDTNTTSLVIQALAATGQPDSDLVTSGLAYLETAWLEDGAGYSALPDTLADANSTALVIQAQIAAGVDVTAQLETLASFQNQSGAFFYNATDTSDNLFATLQAVPALAALPLPISPANGGEATPVAFGDQIAA